MSMYSLLYLISDKYNQIVNQERIGVISIPFERLICSGDECAKFIRSVLNDREIDLPNEVDSYYQFKKDRATHAVLTFLIGLVFFDFLDISGKIASAFFPNNPDKKKDTERLWMFTALYHDWAYTSPKIENPHLVFHEKYDLLSDNYSDNGLQCLSFFSTTHPEAFAHNYEQIRAYDRYARAYHLNSTNRHNHKKSNKPKEVIDHGILGGITIFNRLVRNAIRINRMSEKELLVYKSACITIAQHNIFKSDSPDRDSLYKKYSGGDELEYLYFNNGFSIGIDKPLLYLLCLVDTFECIKRFGQSENKGEYLQTKTVLENINLKIEGSLISIDYSNLLAHIQRERKKAVEYCFSERYIKGIEQLGFWTDITVRTIDEDNAIHTRFELLKTDDLSALE